MIVKCSNTVKPKLDFPKRGFLFSLSKKGRIVLWGCISGGRLAKYFRQSQKEALQEEEEEINFKEGSWSILSLTVPPYINMEL